MSADRKIAVSKYGEVTQTLEFAREFSKQILQIATVSEKELKKKQKKVTVFSVYFKILLKHVFFFYRMKQ